jgi:hypothetical protein
LIAPNVAITARYTAVVEAIRVAIQSWWPAMMSRTPSGVASIARYCRVHLNDATTGHVDSPDATCIAVAASIPGATKSTYDTPSG